MERKKIDPPATDGWQDNKKAVERRVVCGRDRDRRRERTGRGKSTLLSTTNKYWW